MTETNITTSQLEAWAGLAWSWQKLAEFSGPKFSLGPGVLLTDERDGTPWGDTIDQTNAALIAAAPALAAALLAERKAREVEVGELREEISIWQSVFPDIAPDSVMPDRSKIEAENARLSILISRLRASIFSYANAFSFSASPSEVTKCLMSLVAYIDTNTDARQALKGPTP